MTQAATESTALEAAKPQKSPAIITSPESFHESMQFWRAQRYNILTPFTNLSGMATGYGIITAVVLLNPDKEGGDVYEDVPWVKKGDVALAKKGLRRLADCAGITTKTVRTDATPPRQPVANYWEFKATAEWRGVDGSLVSREATYEWDLRDGSDRMKGWTEKQIQEGRKHGLRNCETRAINAAIREYGIKQSFTKAELAKPFVVCRAMFQPDMSNPRIAELVTAASLGATHLLYPAGQVPTLGEIVERDGGEDEDGPRHVGSGRGEPAAADKPPVEGAVRIEKVEEQKILVGKAERTQWLVIDSSGVEGTTFDAVIAKAAMAYRDGRVWVEIAGHGGQIIEIVKVVVEPKL